MKLFQSLTRMLCMAFLLSSAAAVFADTGDISGHFFVPFEAVYFTDASRDKRSISLGNDNVFVDIQCSARYLADPQSAQIGGIINRTHQHL